MGSTKGSAGFKDFRVEFQVAVLPRTPSTQSVDVVSHRLTNNIQSEEPKAHTFKTTATAVRS